MKNIAAQMVNFDREQMRRIANNMPEQYDEKPQVLVLIRTPLRLVHMDTPSPLTLLVTRKTPSKTSHLTTL